MNDQADPICLDCEPVDDGGFICDPELAHCPYGVGRRRAKAFLAPARQEIADIRATLTTLAARRGTAETGDDDE